MMLLIHCHTVPSLKFFQTWGLFCSDLFSTFYCSASCFLTIFFLPPFLGFRLLNNSECWLTDKMVRFICLVSLKFAGKWLLWRLNCSWEASVGGLYYPSVYFFRTFNINLCRSGRWSWGLPYPKEKRRGNWNSSFSGKINPLPNWLMAEIQ